MNAVSASIMAGALRQSAPAFIEPLPNTSRPTGTPSGTIVALSCGLSYLKSGCNLRPCALPEAPPVGDFGEPGAGGARSLLRRSFLQMGCRDTVLAISAPVALLSAPPMAALTLIAFAEWPLLQVSALLSLGHPLRADPAPCGSRCSASQITARWNKEEEGLLRRSLRPSGLGFQREMPRAPDARLWPEERAVISRRSLHRKRPFDLGSRALRVAARKSVPREIRTKTK
jgi:hypothetical protein